ncbi:hypothetical protein T492DRAFT_1126453, partial [Pavlovales sp. CCMP2436]
VTNYTITLVKNPSLNVFVSRIFNWNSLDTPAEIVTKWHNTMRPTIDSVSFGHCSISFNVLSGKFSAVSDMSTAYGSFEGRYKANRNIGTDPSKNSLGLLPTNNAFNPSWESNMSPIPFENVAQVAYFRGGVKKDGQNRIEVELHVTGSNAAVQRQIRYDISRKTGSRDRRTVVDIHSDVSSGHPCVRLGNRKLSLFRDFGQKNIQASKSKNVNFQGIYAQAANARFFQQTTNSWIVTTDNASGDIQCHVNPSYSLSAVDVFTKESPTFNNNISIQTSQDWNNSDGWRLPITLSINVSILSGGAPKGLIQMSESGGNT